MAGFFFEALSGRRPSFHLLDHANDIPADTDSTVRLPRRVTDFGNTRDNWRWYRVALAFRALRYEPVWGTFAAPNRGATEGGRQRLQRALARTPNPSMARAAFEVVDGARMDAVLLRLQPGLRADLDLAHGHALPGVLNGLAIRPPRGQLLTALLAASLLRGPVEVELSASVVDVMDEALQLLDQAAAPTAVQDAIALTDRLYLIVGDLPPMSAEGGAHTTHLRALLPRPMFDEPAPVHRAAGEEASIEGATQFGLDVPRLQYRGALGTRDLDHRDTGRFRSSALIAWRDEVDARKDHRHGHLDLDVEDDDREDGPPQPIPHEHGDVPRWDVPWVPPVDIREANVFWYPEWDGLAGRYLRDHCRVIEESLPRAAKTGFASRVLQAHGTTVAALSREWSRLPREGLQLRRCLEDGDEINLDRAIAARVDLRAGAQVDDRIYQRKVPTERDVATVVLVDLSMSTADQVDAGPDEPPLDPEAMRLYGKARRTVLDHEREAALLLAEMMDRVGDESLVLGFSSSGRETVRLQVIKELEERTSAAAGRFAELRPLDATRMGAAIRHGTARLRRLEARSRFMLVVTDGLPYDEGYGAQYGELERDYTMFDTARALDEAEEAGVTTLVLLTGEAHPDRQGLAGFGDRVRLVPRTPDLVAAMAHHYLGMRAPSAASVFPSSAGRVTAKEEQ